VSLLAVEFGFALAIALAAVRLVFVDALVVHALIDGTDLSVVASPVVDATIVYQFRLLALVVLTLVDGADVLVVAVGIYLTASGHVPIEALLGLTFVVGARVVVVALDIGIAAVECRFEPALPLEADGLLARLGGGRAIRGIVAASLARHPVALVIGADVLGAVDVVVAIRIVRAAARLAYVGLVNALVLHARIDSAVVIVVAFIHGLAAAAQTLGIDHAEVAQAGILGARVVVFAIRVELAQLRVLEYAHELLARVHGSGIEIIALGIIFATAVAGQSTERVQIVLAKVVQALVDCAFVQVLAIRGGAARAPGNRAVHGMYARAVHANVRCTRVRVFAVRVLQAAADYVGELALAAGARSFCADVQVHAIAVGGAAKRIGEIVRAPAVQADVGRAGIGVVAILRRLAAIGPTHERERAESILARFLGTGVVVIALLVRLARNRLLALRGNGRAGRVLQATASVTRYYVAGRLGPVTRTRKDKKNDY